MNADNNKFIERLLKGRNERWNALPINHQEYIKKQYSYYLENSKDKYNDEYCEGFYIGAMEVFEDLFDKTNLL